MKRENSTNSSKALPITILITGILLFLIGPTIFSFIGYSIGFRNYLVSAITIYVISIILIIYSIVLFKQSSKKAYKAKSFNKGMKVQHIFYVIGVLFIFASVWYFSREFIRDLPDSIKIFLLVIGIILSFIIAEFLRGADK